jgi:hypothetical protein
MSQKTVTLGLNKENMIGALKNSFTNKETFLGELMQNARRAGATKIEFKYDEETNTLTIEDDGCGLDNFETLLTVAESGWSKEVVEAESPFGIGFLSAIFSCEEVQIVSKCGVLHCLTEDLLQFKPCTVIPEGGIHQPIGTSILMVGCTALKGDTTIKKSATTVLLKALQHLALGFPIPVSFNGTELPRPNAVGSNFVKTEIGDVHVPLNYIGVEYMYYRRYHNFVVYLQGLPVDTPNLDYYTRSEYDSKLNIVVHLDSAKFIARLPDRDKLINEQENMAIIRAGVREAVRETALSLIAAGDYESVCKSFSTINHYDLLELYNEVPILPCGVLRHFINGKGVNCDSESFGDCKIPVSEYLTREKVSGNTVTSECDFDKYGMVHLVYAKMKKKYIYTSWYANKLDSKHWLFEEAVNLDKEEYSIKLNGEVYNTEFTGGWLYCGVTFCDSYELTIAGDTIVVSDLALYSGDGSNLIVPSGVTTGDCISQVSSFKDYDSFQDTSYCNDVAKFEQFMVTSRLRHDPEKAFLANLREIDAMACLSNKTFTVDIGETGKVVSVVEVKK